MELQKITDKVIIVTGAGSGLGKAVSRKLSENGAKVILWDIKKEQLDLLVNELVSSDHVVKSMLIDVSSESEVKDGILQVEQEFKRIDGLINCAGIDVTKPIEEMTISEWDRVVGVDLRGPFLTSKFAYEKMITQKGGHIINVISTAAKRAWPNASVYHAVKWGLLGFTYSLLAEGRKYNIKVTAVIPGGMKTPFLLERFPDIDIGTLQDPENVAEAIFEALSFPPQSNIAEVMILPMKETSWP